jgi:hypothetical protein
VTDQARRILAKDIRVSTWCSSAKRAEGAGERHLGTSSQDTQQETRCWIGKSAGVLPG